MVVSESRRTGQHLIYAVGVEGMRRPMFEIPIWRRFPNTWVIHTAMFLILNHMALKHSPLVLSRSDVLLILNQNGKINTAMCHVSTPTVRETIGLCENCPDGKPCDKGQHTPSTADEESPPLSTPCSIISKHAPPICSRPHKNPECRDRGTVRSIRFCCKGECLVYSSWAFCSTAGDTRLCFRIWHNV